jgi:transcriptional regulator with XRE-family HTH domain
MSRQELADAVNAHVYATSRRVVSFDANHVGKLERGEVRWPTSQYRAALCAVLGAARPADLGFYITKDGVDPDPPEPELTTDAGKTSPQPHPAPVAPADQAGARITCEQVDQAHANLGGQLAHWRKSAGLTQSGLAERVRYSRSTVANVEVGRHNIRRDFWQRADQETGAGGTLLASFDHACELSSAWRVQAAQDRHQRMRELAGLNCPAPDAMAASSSPQEADVQGDSRTPVPAVVAGGLTLTVTATGSGGVRLIIETGPTDYADAGTGAYAEGARVYSMEQARRSRTGRPA